LLYKELRPFSFYSIFFLNIFYFGTDIAVVKVQGENLHGTAAGRVEFQREIRPAISDGFLCRGRLGTEKT
jgi:hypothetical protein